jgi:excinuclease UvrABC ATPase subunit
MDQCTECRGEGSVPATEHYRGRYWTIAVPCHTCRGTGQVRRPATIIQFPAWPTAKIVQLPLPAS